MLLEQFVRELYPDEILARRALLAPWPGRGFRSVWRQWLQKPLEELDGLSVLQWLDRAAHKGILSRTVDALRDKLEPHAHAWSILMDELHPSYNYS